MVFPKIETFIQSILAEEHQIESDRKKQLLDLAAYIRNELEQQQKVYLNFICTHNSRRSHLAQIWTAVAANFFGISGIHSFSGGTEATAFNPRAVAALKRVGFQIVGSDEENPHYQVYFSPEQAPLIAWSKTFDAPSNPQQDFAAVMTCSDADENCPFIPGASQRFPLTYEDPKEADNTPQEAQRYDERVRQIGREICWMIRQVSGQLGES